MQQNVRGALDLMLREIQMAGYKPAGGTFNGIQTSTSTTLRVKLDLDSSGVETDGSTDDISYTFDSSTGLITRTLNNSGASATVQHHGFHVYVFGRQWRVNHHEYVRQKDYH